jgi:hypothetical protein
MNVRGRRGAATFSQLTAFDECRSPNCGYLITPHGGEAHTRIPPHTTPDVKRREGRTQRLRPRIPPDIAGRRRTPPSARWDWENRRVYRAHARVGAVRKLARCSSPDMRGPITPCGSTHTENARCTPPDSGSAHTPTMKNTIGAQQWVSIFIITCPSRKDCSPAALSSTKPSTPRCLD